jgi:hypothetical protein
MRRLFYLAVGVGIGVAAVRRISKAADRLTPSGLAGTAQRSLGGLGDSLRDFLDDVKMAMAQREAELHDALAADAQRPPGRG